MHNKFEAEIQNLSMVVCKGGCADLNNKKQSSLALKLYYNIGFRQKKMSETYVSDKNVWNIVSSRSKNGKFIWTKKLKNCIVYISIQISVH